MVTSYRRVKARWKREILPFKTLTHLSRYDSRFPRYHRSKKKVFFFFQPFARNPINSCSKLGKVWTAAFPKIVTSGQRVGACSKRGSLLFQTPFHLSRYNFRLPRYRRAKKRVIFNRSPSSLLALAPCPFSSKLEPFAVRISKKRCRPLSRVLVNGSRYRDESEFLLRVNIV